MERLIFMSAIEISNMRVNINAISSGSGIVKNFCLSGIAIVFATMGQASAGATWEYREVEDNFTDKTHHVASITNTSPLSSDKFKASFECRNGKKFVFSLSAGKNLGGRNELFKVQYRIDDKHSKTIKMRIFTNSETGGMNRYNAINIANDILNAERLRVRVITDKGDRYDSEFSLENSKQSILKSVEACGLYLRD